MTRVVVGNLILVFVLTCTNPAFAMAKPSAVVAANQPTTASSSPQQSDTPPPAQANKVRVYCPAVSALTRTGGIWRSGTLWQDYSQSFAQNIDSFIGAQWIGVKVGKIICLYRGKERYAFPVALEPVHPVLVLEPTDENWGDIPGKQGYKQCLSNDVTDCPFYQQLAAPKTDIYSAIKYQGPSSS